MLFGKVDPGGKLPMSFPRDVGQIPISYNELPAGRPFDPDSNYTSKYLEPGSIDVHVGVSSQAGLHDQFTVR